jgi:hypothetical protein
MSVQFTLERQNAARQLAGVETANAISNALPESLAALAAIGPFTQRPISKS